MERIKGLYDNYSRAEKKYFKAYLTAFSGSGSNKGLDFIRLIEKKPNISQEEASLNLYGEAGSKAFIMMKSRLYEKMLERPLVLNPLKIV